VTPFLAVEPLAHAPRREGDGEAGSPHGGGRSPDGQMAQRRALAGRHPSHIAGAGPSRAKAHTQPEPSDEPCRCSIEEGGDHAQDDI